MSEQQSGAGYPQPTSGQPQQGGYGQTPYASPQAQYQQQQYQQQQYAAYAQQGPSLFEKLGVPSMTGLLAVSALGAAVLGGLVAGFADEAASGPAGWATSQVGVDLFGGLALLVLLVGLTLFFDKKYRPLWKLLALAVGILKAGSVVVLVVSLDYDLDSSTDIVGWIGLILVLAAYGVLVYAVLTADPDAPAKPAAPQAPAAPQGYATGQQAAQGTTQLQQPQQPQQQPGQPGQSGQPGQPQQGQGWPQAPQ